MVVSLSALYCCCQQQWQVKGRGCCAGASPAPLLHAMHVWLLV
jgi:hypothetical protein